MEVSSTTNPTAPTGGTNPTAPLGISSSLSTTVKNEVNFSGWSELSLPILIGSFQVNSSQAIGTPVYEWSTRNTKLGSSYNPQSTDGFLPWSLIMPWYSKMVRMEYALLFKPYKVADAEVRFQAIWNYTGLPTTLSTRTTANHNEVFSFDDSSDEKIITVPQYFMHDNVTTNKSYNTIDPQVPSWVPHTVLTVLINNPYQPNLAQPDNFNVQVFLIPMPQNIKVIAGRRTVFGGNTSGNQLTIFPEPYFM